MSWKSLMKKMAIKGRVVVRYYGYSVPAEAVAFVSGCDFYITGEGAKRLARNMPGIFEDDYPYTNTDLAIVEDMTGRAHEVGCAVLLKEKGEVVSALLMIEDAIKR